MHQDDIIKSSNSPWSSLVMVVPKPDGGLHLCNDFQRVNAISKFDNHPLQFSKGLQILSCTHTNSMWQPTSMILNIPPPGQTGNPKECHPGRPEAQNLGYHIGRGVLQPQYRKVGAIRSYPHPRTKKQVYAFLGLAGYYRQSVPNFSSVASPFFDLNRKVTPEQVTWTQAVERAFQQLKDADRRL